MKFIVFFGLFGLATAHHVGGLVALTNPAVMGVANPLLAGAGRGVAGAAAGTQQTADLLGDAIGTFVATVGRIGNLGKGVGVAIGNAAPAIQGTVSAVQNNNGIVGKVVDIVTA